MRDVLARFILAQQFVPAISKADAGVIADRIIAARPTEGELAAVLAANHAVDAPVAAHAVLGMLDTLQPQLGAAAPAATPAPAVVPPPLPAGALATPAGTTTPPAPMAAPAPTGAQTISFPMNVVVPPPPPPPPLVWGTPAPTQPAAPVTAPITAAATPAPAPAAVPSHSWLPAVVVGGILFVAGLAAFLSLRNHAVAGHKNHAAAAQQMAGVSNQLATIQTTAASGTAASQRLVRELLEPATPNCTNGCKNGTSWKDEVRQGAADSSANHTAMATVDQATGLSRYGEIDETHAYVKNGFTDAKGNPVKMSTEFKKIRGLLYGGRTTGATPAPARDYTGTLGTILQHSANADAAAKAARDAALANGRRIDGLTGAVNNAAAGMNAASANMDATRKSMLERPVHGAASAPTPVRRTLRIMIPPASTNAK